MTYRENERINEIYDALQTLEGDADTILAVKKMVVEKLNKWILEDAKAHRDEWKRKGA